jgi:hypothetical protein
MKTGADALGKSQNLVQERKTGKRAPTPSVPSNMSPGAQNLITCPDGLGTSKNVSESAKL